MASGRARLPPTPTTTVTTTIRHHIDIQNNTIPITVTSAVPTTSDNFTTSNMAYNNNNINDDTINALGPDLAEATTQVLDNLSDQERQIILNVLTRDENVRQREAARIM